MPTHTREVEVNFTGGSRKGYVVTFDKGGETVCIEVIVRRGMDYGSHRRMFWHRRLNKELSERGRIIVRRAANDLRASG